MTYPDALIQLDLLFVVLFGIEGIETDVVVVKLSPNLYIVSKSVTGLGMLTLTFSLKASRSSSVKLSALAITGTTLTTSLSFFMTMMSIGRSEWPVGLMKNRQQWIRVSWM